MTRELPGILVIHVAIAAPPPFPKFEVAMFLLEKAAAPWSYSKHLAFDPTCKFQHDTPDKHDFFLKKKSLICRHIWSYLLLCVFHGTSARFSHLFTRSRSSTCPPEVCEPGRCHWLSMTQNKAAIIYEATNMWICLVSNLQNLHFHTHVSGMKHWNVPSFAYTL